MPSKIDKLVQEAYKTIDDLPDYKIPKIERWKKENEFGIEKVTACKSCGKQLLYVSDKKPVMCISCRKKISYLYRKRTNKGKK